MKRKQTTVVILPTPEEKVARLYANPIHQFLVTQLTKATDQELIEYGEAIAAVLGLLVGWAKRACVGWPIRTTCGDSFTQQRPLCRCGTYWTASLSWCHDGESFSVR